MTLITLTTDFGLHDHYVGVMKGVILSRTPEARIVDLSHAVHAHDVRQAAWLIAANYRYFPPGSIHVLIVDPGVGSGRRIIMLSVGEHYFLAPDNGLLSLVVQEAHDDIKCFEVKRPDLYLKPLSQTFHGRDIFAPLAAYLAKSNSIYNIGPGLDPSRLVSLNLPSPVIDCDRKQIAGGIIDIDHFGNIITNIKTDHINKLAANPAEVLVTLGNRSLTGITASYDSVPAGRPLLILNSGSYLEIAVNQGRADDYFQIGPTAKILLQVD